MPIGLHKTSLETHVQMLTQADSLTRSGKNFLWVTDIVKEFSVFCCVALWIRNGTISLIPIMTQYNQLFFEFI